MSEDQPPAYDDDPLTKAREKRANNQLYRILTLGFLWFSTLIAFATTAGIRVENEKRQLVQQIQELKKTIEVLEGR